MFVLVALCAFALAASGLLYAYSDHAQESARLRRAADRLTTPSGWTFIGSYQESGSGFPCFISCFHPGVTKVYRTSAPPPEACAVARAQVSREVASAEHTSYDSNCGWRAPIASVGSRATVGAGAQTASVLRAWRSPPWPGRIDATAGGTYVWVYFSGGPT